MVGHASSAAAVLGGVSQREPSPPCGPPQPPTLPSLAWPDRSVNDAINDLLDVDGDALPDLFITDLARNQSSHSWGP